MTNTNIHLIYIIMSICIAACVAFISFSRRKSQGGKSIIVLSLATMFCYIFYLQNNLSSSDLIKQINIALTYLGMALAATAMFTFSLRYTLRTRRINLPIILLFSIIPVLTQILFWIPEDTNLTLSILIEKLNILYRYSLIMATLWMFIRPIKLWFSLFNIKSLLLIAGPLIAFIIHALLLIDFNWGLLGELSLVSLTLSAIGFSYNAFQSDSMAGLFVNRESVVQNMEDGWIFLNTQNLIIDINQTTADLIGLPPKNLYGKFITSVLTDFPDMTYMLDEDREIEMDRTIRINEEYRYLNIRISALRSTEGNKVGRLIIWRDITDRRRAEDARQQARDEMFVLLNAISSAAGQTTNIQEFLSDVIYQIIYPFRSQIVFFFLIDEQSSQDDEEKYYLGAQLGLSPKSVKKLRTMFASTSMFDWPSENRQYLLLEDSQNKHLPEPMQELKMACFLAIPLILQTGGGEKIIGGLFLGRKEKPVYKQDEIIRLTILADQIANLIDSDHRRKLAISLSERQRLMRDIHDSVSQKLYGLVTLTEAAQAAIEAGSHLDYGQVLSRIGENARQAVKELRLFLFQMLPIDLEKEGIVSVLHHRLAAVEGRADIKVRFLADEQIQISKKKEVALYYIAQEALNNVLRHARAKSVSVTLKQGYKYVTLEVFDDGCGFESENLGQGGMGLNNIKERVSQENGKLKISSKADKGTIIKVSFVKDLPEKPGKANK